MCLLLPAMGLPGCFSICPWEAVLEWQQPGLYDAFPPSGSKGGYEIWWTTEDPAKIRGPDEKEALKMAEGESILLSVGEADDVVWIHERDGRTLRESVLREMVEGTFADLGLGRPGANLQNSTAETGHVTC